jgi:uncharacterized protein YgiM (DUF1202 family)
MGSEILYVGKVTGKRVNLRTGPHLNHTVIFAADQDTDLFAIEEKEGWVKVFLPEAATVWIHGDLVDKQSNRIGTVRKDAVNLRVRPSTNTYIIGQLNKGDDVAIREERFGWLKIKVPPQTEAWISKVYFKPWMSIKDYRQSQRHNRVKEIYAEVEQLQNKELLKDPDKRDYPFLLKKYHDILTQYPDLPEARLAKHRYTETLSWQAEKDWESINDKWNRAIPKETDEDQNINLKPFIKIYQNFIKKYPQTTYLLIAKDRLHFLKKNPIIGSFNKNLLKKGAKRETVLSGIIHDLGKLINRPATHKLMKDGEILCLLRSDSLDLGDSMFRNVTISGQSIEVKGWNIPIVEVKKITKKKWTGRF